MTNVEEIAEDLEKVWADLETHSLSTLMDVIKQLGKLATEIPVSLQNCEAISGDITKFENWASIFLHPTRLLPKLEENIPAHLSEIVADVRGAKKLFDMQNFFDGGEKIGEALVLSVGQAEATSIRTLLRSFAKKVSRN
jgi:hypothetical protein